MTTGFRGDVQGLRAIAVLTVIAAHAGVPFLPGGFVGVDVFFVISGFLISGLLYRELRTGGTLSLRGFWSRRARRILPAATLVIATTLVFSSLTLTLIANRSAIVDAIWAGLFGANIHFAHQGVYYFAEDTGPSPLQHYWSLAVEEQFYVLFPLLLLAVAAVVRRVTRRGRQQRLPFKTVLAVLVAVTLGSFVWSVVATASSPTTAYFSTFTRVWELGVGAIAALVAPWVSQRLGPRLGALLGAGGLAAVVAACVLYTPATAFPGYAAALPVLGTVALLLSGLRRETQLVPLRWLLETRLMRTTGDWSYSLYLWHWPALVLAEAHVGRELTATETAVVVLLVFNLAAATYQFVEQPFRSGLPAVRLRGARALALYPASIAVLVASTAGAWGYTAYQGRETGDNPPITVAADAAAAAEERGEDAEALVKASVQAARGGTAIPSDLTPNLLDLRESIADVGDCDYTEDDVRRLCVRGDTDGDKTLVLVGDSHARAWIPAMDQIATAAGWRAFYLVKPQCPAGHVTVSPTADDDVVFTACTEFQDWVTATIDSLHPDLVVISSAPPVNGVWDDDGVRHTAIDEVVPLLEQGYDQMFLELQDDAERVVVIRDVPKSEQDPGDCLSGSKPSLLDCMFSPVERSTILGDVVVRSAALNGAEVIDPTPWLCWRDECPVVIGGTLSYRDTNHITTEYAARLAGSLGRALELD